jgi:hypothetical protein
VVVNNLQAKTYHPRLNLSKALNFNPTTTEPQLLRTLLESLIKILRTLTISGEIKATTTNI